MLLEPRAVHCGRIPLPAPPPAAADPQAGAGGCSRGGPRSSSARGRRRRGARRGRSEGRGGMRRPESGAAAGTSFKGETAFQKSTHLAHLASVDTQPGFQG
ncbi:unnamed protein product [Eretmochelys imbricata]